MGSAKSVIGRAIWDILLDSDSKPGLGSTFTALTKLVEAEFGELGVDVLRSRFSHTRGRWMCDDSVSVWQAILQASGADRGDKPDKPKDGSSGPKSVSDLFKL